MSCRVPPRAAQHARVNGALARLRACLALYAARAHTPACCACSLLEVLSSLIEFLADVDCALEFAAVGGHAPLLAILSHCAAQSTDDDAALLDAAAEAVAAASALLPRGWAFPVSIPHTVIPPVLSFDFCSWLRAPLHDADVFAGICKGAVGGGTDDVDRLSRLRVLLRCPPPSVRRQESQRDVGAALWPCALPLARWLVAHRTFLSGRHVLELGSGVGLCGIVAALYAGDGPPVTLSDAYPDTLADLTYNCALNDPTLHESMGLEGGEDDGAYGITSVWRARSSAPCMAITRLDWSEQKTESVAGGHYDIIIGSDLICCEADASHLASTIASLLSAKGVCILFSPPPHARFGVSSFESAVRKRGLCVEARGLHTDFLATRVGGGEEALREGAAFADEVTTASGYEGDTIVYVVRHDQTRSE